MLLPSLSPFPPHFPPPGGTPPSQPKLHVTAMHAARGGLLRHACCCWAGMPSWLGSAEAPAAVSGCCQLQVPMACPRVPFPCFVCFLYCLPVCHWPIHTEENCHAKTHTALLHGETGLSFYAVARSKAKRRVRPLSEGHGHGHTNDLSSSSPSPPPSPPSTVPRQAGRLFKLEKRRDGRV